MSGRLTTHVLDTAAGRPASLMRVELLRCDGAELVRLADVTTNADGRVDSPILEGEAFVEGSYELRFHVAAYFARIGEADAGRFLDVVPVAFRIDDASAHYHVPLLVTPWSYSTYRGS
ncbi:MAG: hydroxyisourate hydrolase [Planctomycetota bacterium]